MFANQSAFRLMQDFFNEIIDPKRTRCVNRLWSPPSELKRTSRSNRVVAACDPSRTSHERHRKKTAVLGSCSARSDQFRFCLSPIEPRTVFCQNAAEMFG